MKYYIIILGIYLPNKRNGLIKMDNRNPEIWNTLFGTAWDKLTDNLPEVGAFILQHNTKTFILDSNGKKLLNYRKELSYDELSTIINDLIEQDAGAPTMLRTIIAHSDEDITAGYLYIRNGPETEMDSALPLCTQAQLIAALSECTKPSLLALIQIDEYGNPNLWSSDISQVVALIIEKATGALIAAASRNRVWLFVPNFTENKTEYLNRLQNDVKKCQLTSRSGHNITLTVGCGADIAVPTQRLRSAEFSLFDAAESGIGSISLYSDDRYEQQKTEYDNMKRFTRLVEKNLFVYHFQPIVSARNGDIVAYEALMRTDKSINMFPLEILGAATKLGRLYDIEKATMRNALQFISSEQDIFKDRKLFVNSIPAHILSSQDWEALVQDYGELMEKLVVEMTEQTQLDNDRLAVIHDRLKRNNIELAIDDYGTGYSNTSNLLRYRPDYVKIDRSLIEGIESKPAIQKLVQGLIQFTHDNGFSALAEGVETADELKTMIRLGADLIQGYYISKPKPFVLHEITDNLKEEISEINRMYSDEILKVYHPAKGEVVNLYTLNAEHYSSIYIENDNVTIEGQLNVRYNTPIVIKDGLTAKLTLRNASITTDKDDACITLGTDCHIDLHIDGVNHCYMRGIWVPHSSSFRLLGCGSLSVHCEKGNSYGIGTDRDHSHGNIFIECSGKLMVSSQGENAVAIGGGKNLGESVIKILSGDIIVNCSGGNCVGIGNFDGNSIIEITDCSCNVEISASNALGIGSMSGRTDIYLSNFIVKTELSGITLCGIGSLENGCGKITLFSGTVHGVMHGKSASCIGSHNGSIDCDISSCNISLYCEGGQISGIGDIDGDSNISIRETSLIFTFLAKEGLGVSTRSGTITIENCIQDIKVNE